MERCVFNSFRYIQKTQIPCKYEGFVVYCRYKNLLNFCLICKQIKCNRQNSCSDFNENFDDKNVSYKEKMLTLL